MNLGVRPSQRRLMALLFEASERISQARTDALAGPGEQQQRRSSHRFSSEFLLFEIINSLQDGYHRREGNVSTIEFRGITGRIRHQEIMGEGRLLGQKKLSKKAK